MSDTDTTILRASANYSGDPWGPTNSYFQDAEEGMNYCWQKHIFPIINNCNFDVVIDLAAGHGRNSVKLLELTTKLIIQDIQPANVEACKIRFNAIRSIDYFVGNGYNFNPVESSTVSLVYCFDAMVHFNPDVVRSYLLDSRRVLKVGGHGFFHHSNYTGGVDWKKNPAGRNFMSKSMFADICSESGLKVINQKIINWNNHINLDCLTLVEKVY
jgi:SAM-dependent methyltransferase